MSSREFIPFADDESALSLGCLTLENGRSAIVVHGDLSITRDAEGLAVVQALLQVLSSVAAEIQRGPEEAVSHEEQGMVDVVSNPFA